MKNLSLMLLIFVVATITIVGCKPKAKTKSDFPTNIPFAKVFFDTEPAPTCIIVPPTRIDGHTAGMSLYTHEEACALEKKEPMQNNFANGFSMNGLIFSNRHVLGIAGKYHSSEGDIDYLNAPAYTYIFPDLKKSTITDAPETIYLNVKGFNIQSQKNAEIRGDWSRYTPSLKPTSLNKKDTTLLLPVYYIIQTPKEYYDSSFAGMSGSPALDKSNNVFGIYSGLMHIKDPQGIEKHYFMVTPFETFAGK